MIIIYLFLTLFYVSTNILLGLSLLGPIFKKQKYQWPPLIILITGFLFGQGILASIWLFLSLSGHLKNYIVWPILAFIIFVSIPVWPYLYKLSGDIIKSFANPFKNLSIFWQSFLAIIILLIVTLAIGSIILPPSGDGESFYMVLPKIMAYTGSFKPPHDYLLFSQIGLLGEFHFAVLMIIANPAAAKFLVWFDALAVVGLLFYIGKLIGLKAKGQIIMLSVLLTSSAFTNYITDGKTDIFSAAFGLVTYYWLFQLNKKRTLSLILTGLFLGFAIVTKLSNVIPIVPGILLYLGWNDYLEFKNRKLLFLKLCARFFIGVIIIAFFASLSFCPTLVKNHFLSSEPVTTLYASNWSNPIISISNTNALPFVSRNITNLFSAITLSFKHVIEMIVDVPLLLTFWEYPIKGNNLSILILAFIPLLFFRQKNILIRKQICFIAILGLAVWVFARSTVLEPRYILSTLLIFIPIVSASVENILEKSFFLILKKVIMVSIFLILILCLTVQLFLKFSPSYIRGTYRQAMQFINLRAAPGERVFLAGSYSYFLRPDLLVTLNTPLHNVNEEPSSFWMDIYNQGFNYVIIQKVSYGPALLDKQRNTPLVGVKIDKIYSDSGSDIYSLIKASN
jgi:hypothetical protein